ncbi:hypothetical protein [Tenacibaculum aquimarinum]|uniref:hypothetical protein n=1 Tax=Tenacibaculum aquimarinum TaxID=2910675 RepID=UPI001F0A7FEC|nr:hypothetical protein [Tenacibaculum aquimarinum]MCH3883261.1 hypothetical protein [Tenacibaculum aquimarinum]
MKKVFLVFAMLFATGVFTSCTDLDENLENEPTEVETLATGGEDSHIPDDDDDDDDDDDFGGGN